MRQWTLEERQRQAELIRNWKPWRTAGVKTPEGKAKSRMNAYKHGAYSAEVTAELKAMRQTLRECRERLICADAVIKVTKYAYRHLIAQKTGKRGLPLLKNNSSAFTKFPKVEERIIKRNLPQPAGGRSYGEHAGHNKSDYHLHYTTLTREKKKIDDLALKDSPVSAFFRFRRVQATQRNFNYLFKARAVYI